MKIQTRYSLIILLLLGSSFLLHSCKKEELPVLSTSSITNITGSSAVGGGNITSDGNSDITSRGVCWSLEANPTTKDSKTDDGSGSGQFVSDITGLGAGTTYHARAYAINSAGTAYGADLSFATLGNVPECLTQASTNITSSGATLNGTVNANYLSTTVTFEYGITTTYGQTFTSSQSPVTGNSITNVSADISGLTPGTTYHYRVVAVNSIGTTNGNDLTFTTGEDLPILTTTPITNRTTTSVTTGGNISSDGGSDITARGVCWATTSNPTILNNKTSEGAGNEAFTSNISELIPDMSYFVRAYATNSSGTAYGDNLNFTTLPGKPTLTTASTTDKLQTSATSGGNVLYDGGSAVTARGVCWSTYPNPTLASSYIGNGTGTGSFLINLISLTPGTTYYVRAFATNSYGTSYGNNEVFTTLATIPTITTTISSFTTTTATTGGNVTADGGSSVTEKGICWGTDPNPTIAGLHVSDGIGIGAFTTNLSGLSPNTVYYLRAYAINSEGIAYGNLIVLKTKPVALGILETNIVSSITENSAISGGNITDDGGAFIRERGVCWSENINPTIYDFKTTDGSGTGAFSSNLTGLLCGRIYFLRAYATNSLGVAYGSKQIFTTKMIPAIFNPNLAYGSVSDIEGNLYKTIQIGTQIWMAENLRTTKYNDGSSIPNVTDDIVWNDLTTSGYCWFNNDMETYKNTYGAFYNWYTVNSGKLCPIGWHIPSQIEWVTLVNICGGGSVAGGKLKEEGIIHWNSQNIGATNEFGFTGLPSGYRSYYPEENKSFVGNGIRSNYWTSTYVPPSNPNVTEGAVYFTGFIFQNGNFDLSLVQGNQSDGYSVRCIKD